MYAWGIRSLDRRLRYFEIYCNNPEFPWTEEVKDEGKKKSEGPGRPSSWVSFYTQENKARMQSLGRALVCCENIADQRSSDLRSKMSLTKRLMFSFIFGEWRVLLGSPEYL